EDVDLNMPDTEHGLKPLCWAAQNGHEAVVKILLVLEDVRTNTPDDLNQTPLSWALSGGHNQIVMMLQERISCRSNPVHDGGHVVTTQPTVHVQQYAARMLHGGDHLDPNITDLEGPNVNLSTNPKKHKWILGYNE
ncbi:hypothetical protein L873DRAFT_1719829, partial [Choiromyces venosus 120613-1]